MRITIDGPQFAEAIQQADYVVGDILIVRHHKFTGQEVTKSLGYYDEIVPLTPKLLEWLKASCGGLNRP